MSDYLSLPEWALRRVEELTKSAKFYISEGIPPKTALEMVKKETVLSQKYFSIVEANIQEMTK